MKTEERNVRVRPEATESNATRQEHIGKNRSYNPMLQTVRDGRGRWPGNNDFIIL